MLSIAQAHLAAMRHGMLPRARGAPVWRGCQVVLPTTIEKIRESDPNFQIFRPQSKVADTLFFDLNTHP